MESLLPIGRFARLTGLTVKALRHYDEVGLLEPASVDPATGYRYYAARQCVRAEAIRRFTILDTSFRVGDELTPTQKIRRPYVVAKFADEVAELYRRPAG